MKRKQIVAGNWKMNLDFKEGIKLASDVAKKLPLSNALVILGTPAIHLHAVNDIVKNFSGIKVAAQNCHQNDKGAFTGELSLDMLSSVGAEYVILGHSERREYFKEDNALLAKKVNAVLAKGLTPIFCCGEALPIRKKKKHVAHVKKQLQESLFHLKPAITRKLISFKACSIF